MLELCWLLFDEPYQIAIGPKIANNPDVQSGFRLQHRASNWMREGCWNTLN